MKITLFFALVLTSFQGFAQSDCVDFFGPSMHGHTASYSEYPCELHSESTWPGMFGETTVNLFRFHNNWTGNADDVAALTHINTAIQDSMKLLSKYAYGMPKRVHLLYMNDFPDDETLADSNMEMDTCHIRIFYQLPTTGVGGVKAAIAHELHHCYFINRSFNDILKRLPIHNWLLEGMADHFASVVYPKSNWEWGHAEKFNAKLPLTHQSDPYSASVFFQSWSNQGIPLELQHMGVSSLGNVKTEKDFLKALSQVSEIAKYFSTFAEQIFTQTVADSGGGHVPVDPPKPDLSMDLKPGNMLIEYKYKPFSSYIMKLKAPPKGKYTFKIDPNYYNFGHRLSLKTQNGSFQQFRPGSPLSVQVDCDDSFRYIAILLTNTDPDAASTAPLLEITYEETQGDAINCPCKKTNLPVDACLKGRWTGDNGHFAQNVETRANSGGTVVMGNVFVSGVYSMEFTDEKSGVALANAQHIMADLNVGGSRMSYDQVTNYTLEFDFSQQAGKGRFCVDPRQFDGRAVITLGSGDPTEMDLDELLNSIPGARTVTEVNYECTAHTLKLKYTTPQAGDEEWHYFR